MSNNTPEFFYPILDPNKSEKERQDIFLQAYRAADSAQKTIKQVCASLNLPRSEFNLWLCDPEFEELFFAELRAFSYSLTEELATGAAALLQDGVTISKSRFYALQIAQKSVLEIIGKLNRERFGESQEIRLKQEGNLVPQINISLISADIPTISQAYQASIGNDKALEIEHKKEAIAVARMDSESKA